MTDRRYGDRAANEEFIRSVARNSASHVESADRPARELEVLLAVQLGRLAESVLAWLYLAGGTVSEDNWRTVYAARHSASQVYSLDDIEASLDAYIAQFGSRVGSRDVRPASPAQLPLARIVLPEHSARLDEAYLINDLLLKSGSDCRYVFMGQVAAQICELLSVLGLRHERPPVDARFLFGRVGPVTAVPYSALFDFVEEFASSPLLKPDAPGFTVGKAIVLRHGVLSTLPGGGESRAGWEHAFVHESIHTFGGSDGTSFSYAPAGWLRDTRADILRFTRVPRSLDELRQAMQLNFENRVIAQPRSEGMPDFGTLRGLDLRAMVEANSLEVLVQTLADRGRVRWTDEGLLASGRQA